MLQMGGVLCPNPDCGMGLLPEDPGRRVVCPRGQSGGCGVSVCNCMEGGGVGSLTKDPCRKVVYPMGQTLMKGMSYILSLFSLHP